MMKKIVMLITALLVFIFFVMGDANNEPLETQNNGATMCMACIGLE